MIEKDNELVDVNLNIYDFLDYEEFKEINEDEHPGEIENDE
ncbi:MAG: hypothetical protein RR598_08415 [Anaerorhabdus sp.]